MIRPETILQIDSSGITNGGGGGGGSVSSSQPNQTSYDTYIFSLTSNEKNFDAIVNNETLYNTKSIRVSKQTLLNGPVIIKVNKSGYASNEYYEIDFESTNSTIIKNTLLNQTFGLSTKNVVLNYYVGDSLQTTSILNQQISTLNFKLNKASIIPTETEEYRLSVSVSGVGAPVSILKNGIKSAEFFPTIGSNLYSDVKGTTYKISSSDSTKFRITQISVSNESTTEVLTAKDSESLQTTITLNNPYQISIVTEEVRQAEVGLNPQIKLLKSDVRTYNINSKLGVPIAFEKNAAVKAVTVIVGDDILEFDELDAGDIAGITIPHNVFKNIGKYGVKMYPFSLKDYENQVRPPKPAPIVTPKEVQPKFEVSEEVVVAPTPKVQVNPYSQPLEYSSGGGGGLKSTLILDNGGDVRNTSFVNTTKNREAIR